EQNADSSGQKAPLIPASAKPDEGLSPALSGWLLITRDTDFFSPGDSEVDRLMAAEHLKQLKDVLFHHTCGSVALLSCATWSNTMESPQELPGAQLHTMYTQTHKLPFLPSGLPACLSGKQNNKPGDDDDKSYWSIARPTHLLVHHTVCT
ncbi:hypothetical protein KUCAC02_026408, partial [Chaenocephalus aceratus]